MKLVRSTPVGVNLMDYESIEYNRYRWNRMLLNGFWCILIITILLEGMYLTITKEPFLAFITNYMLEPTILQLSLLLIAETAFRVLKGKYQDYIIILTSALLAFIIVYIHNSINYLLLALFLPVMVSVFYFHPKKLIFALCNTMISLYVMYWTNDWMNEDITLVGLSTITVMFLSFSLIAWGILRRGRELMIYLKSYYESNQQLLVKTVWMDKLTKTDALTDLYNHMTFHEYFEELIKQHEDNDLPLQLAIFDIDNFKKVNDLFGHRAGDAVLQRVSELIRSKVSAHDFVARYGGEEFAILFTEKAKLEAFNLVEQIRLEVSQAPHELQQGRPVTVSVGFAEYESGEGKEHFFNRADQALYKAKNMGKNQTVIASGTLESQLA
ncbi:diguanylate cyclase (GGDEF)-like protein [Paenibacillus baekrokdamisoli]|nr:GGDEF domain-containing protein [Paenibacillus baekrokdamisoli]MBB3071194.1 diguanylate cyclase (GGDEF)-like protein [Paenibacillus baekrokdamisoli]